MKLATLLVIILSNNGYWFSGQSGSVNLRSAVKGSCRMQTSPGN